MARGLTFLVLALLTAGQGRAGAVFTVDTQGEWMQGQGAYVDYWTHPGSIRPFRPATSDSFDSATLSEFWTWSPAGSGNSHTVLSGTLFLTCGAGSEWHEVTNSAPKLFQLASGDFSAAAFLQDDRPSHLSAYAGIFVRKDALNWMEVGVTLGTFGGGPDKSIHSRKTINGVHTDIIRHLPLVNPVQVKLSKTGNTISTFFKAPSVTYWTDSAKEDVFFDHYEIGVYAKDTAGKSTVSFYDFSVSESIAPPTSVTYVSRAFEYPAQPVTDVKISWIENVPAGTAVAVQTRSSEDGVSWGIWSGSYGDPSGCVVSSAKLKYVQFRMILTRNGAVFPEVQSVTIVCDKTLLDYEGEVLEADRVHAVPHPISVSQAVIQYELSASVREVLLEFLDASGRRVTRQTGSIESGVRRITWDTTGLANGLYYLRIKVTKEDGKIVRVVKKLAIVR